MSLLVCVSIPMVSMCVGLPVKSQTRHRDLHAGPQQALDGSEDDVVSGGIGSDSSVVDVLGGLWCTCTCCSLLLVLGGVRKQRWALSEVECGNIWKSGRPLFGKHLRCSTHGRSIARVRYWHSMFTTHDCEDFTPRLTIPLKLHGQLG